MCRMAVSDWQSPGISEFQKVFVYDVKPVRSPAVRSLKYNKARCSEGSRGEKTCVEVGDEGLDSACVAGKSFV